MQPEISKHRVLIFVCSVMFLDAVGFGLIMPIMPDLIGELSSLSNSQAATVAGYLLFTFAAMQFLCAPILGGLSDRYGRRPVLLIALLGFALDYFVMAAAPSLAWLFIARMISGLCGATFAAANACLVDISDKGERAKFFGFGGAAVGAGFVFGPMIGGLLGEYGTRLPFIAAGILSLGACLYGYLTFPETLQSENRRAFSLKRANPIGSLISVARFPAVFMILMATFCIQLANHSYSSIWSFYVTEVTAWGPFLIGVSISFYGVLMVGVQGGLVGPVVKRTGEVRAVYFAAVIGAAAFIMLAFADNGGKIYAGIFVGAMSGFVMPALQSLMTSHTEEDAQGELQGAITSLYSLSSVISPLIMAKIFTAWTDETGTYLPGAPFVLATLLVLCSILTFSLGVRKLRPTNRQRA
ncbi:MAG: tetracycline resistance MFS efflux pump [Henriciella sp.]